MKKTVVLGATTNPTRYAHTAVHRLLSAGHEVVPVGIKKGDVAGLTIQNDRPVVEDVDTVTLYIGPRHQPEWYDYVLGLNPKRIIFNPGTVNQEFMQMAESRGIVAEDACTLVLLSLGSY